MPKNEFEEANQEKPVGIVREFLAVPRREQEVVAVAHHCSAGALQLAGGRGNDGGAVHLYALLMRSPARPLVPRREGPCNRPTAQA